MDLSIISFGSHKTSFINQGVQQYRKWLSPYIKVEDLTLSTGKDQGRQPRQTILCKELEKLVQYHHEEDYIVLLDERGQQSSSTAFAKWFHDLKVYRPGRRIVFVIGGTFGIHPSAYDRANRIMGLSQMTLTHEMARLLLYEQIYRAMKILHHEPYHY